MRTKLFLIVSVAYMVTSCGNKPSGNVTSDMLHYPQTASGDSLTDDMPEMVFDSLNFHFGGMAIGQTIKHTFQFVNAGDEPLVISDVHPSCGCTTLKDYPEKPIPAGESGQITVEFKAEKVTGKVDKTITVSCNDAKKFHVLHILGTVIGQEVFEKDKSQVQMQRIR
jgi:hypothetical protein